MDWKRVFFLQAIVLVFITDLVAADPFISDGLLQGHGSTSRSLLQAKTSCPINFEYMDYNIITNKCKGPQYRPEPCCSAFKEFACPYSEQLNDLTNDCATTMFSYINIHGKYPPGLFAYECREGKDGLDCSNYVIKTDNSTSSASMIRSISPVIATVLGVTVALLVYGN
ncbi:GPI-anchored protein LLG1-like [Phalaenopsis equestris]|uniref:GPI-anchored protein LLG1-like n=1 Tax=Phalaenopsis equestris TaxID=78828 RepID=UPI0009E4BB09|nr:GPI-anchored protein LLG1-like [Phalaenopsis equestris]